MHITRTLLGFIRHRHIPGKIDIGKHRLVKPVTKSMKRKAMEKMVQEQRNLDVIAIPYITSEQEQYYKETMDIDNKLFLAQIAESREKKWIKHKTMDDHLNHLNVSKQWE